MRPTILALILVLGCHHRPDTDPDPAPAPAADRGAGEVAVQVKNHNFSDIVISLDQNGRAARLGLAAGHGTTAFLIPWQRLAASGTVRLVGDLLGSPDRIGTELLLVRSGSLVVWTIESSLDQSNAAVY